MISWALSARLKTITLAIAQSEASPGLLTPRLEEVLPPGDGFIIAMPLNLKILDVSLALK